MAEPITYELQDVVEMKKPHACGTNSWRITRIGADIKLTCTNCGRGIMTVSYTHLTLPTTERV